MGKGDKRTKRGKIWNGSFGKSRPHKQTPTPVVVEKKVSKPAAKPKKKAAAK